MKEVSKKQTAPLLVGIDIGSTTTKLAVLDGESRQVLYSDYRRHHADQGKSVETALGLLAEHFPGARFRLAFTGSGAKTLSERLGLSYVQEVVANSIALKELYGRVGTAIELGGQDAKMIFFHTDEATGELQVADMRMNGSCAGGTGAFIDEIAAILKTPVEEFDALAAQGTCVYDISGRCGVYAKTDIQPLLNQGIAKADLALSSFHAIAKQTIGGLAQGLTIERPVAFEGGPLTFHKTLVRVFSEKLGLAPEDMIRPERPEIMIAQGAALASATLFEQEPVQESPEAVLARLREDLKEKKGLSENDGRLYFETPEEKAEFLIRQALPKRDWKAENRAEGGVLSAYLGIDSGSTTTKFVLMDDNEQILDSFYAPNRGDPLAVARQALIEMRDKYRKLGIELKILGCGTTGYGEMLFAKAFSAECHVVETVAHVRATRKFVPDVTFLLDIGGQDMKAVWIDHGIVTNIVVNEACSSGCGSFLENFAATLDVPVKEIAGRAFASRHPAALGSRCTVFMNSSIVTEQRNGKLPEDIMAGLCRSIIENVFTKVIRISNLDSLGDKIVVQGGTFENDAVLRAMEQYVGRKVTRAPYPGIMGAIGAALSVREEIQRNAGKKIDGLQADGVPSEAAAAQDNGVSAEPAAARTADSLPHFIGLDALDDFSYTQEANLPCPFCSNHCKRSVIRFSNGASWVTNNRCERGEILGDPKDSAVREQVKAATLQKEQVPNLYKLREALLFQDYPLAEGLSGAAAKSGGQVIGIPRVLSFWENMPFWNAFFRSLGFRIRLSAPSSHALYEAGLSAVTSDTVCFPAKLVHGHLRDLEAKGVDRIFMPSIAAVGSENTEKTSESMCAVVKGYPLVVRNSDDPARQSGIPFDAPLFYWYRAEDRRRQLADYMEETFGIAREDTLKAEEAGTAAMETFHRTLKEAGAKILEETKKNGTYAVVLASRPYQNDALVNHALPEMFAGFGIPVLTADALPEAEQVDLHMARLDVVNNFHARMLTGAVLAAQSENLEYVQIVSFGCGHDAYLSDEIQRIMKEISGKTPLILKLDESEIQGPLRIRVRSFIETVNMRRRQDEALQVRPLSDPYAAKFRKEDRKKRLVLVPNTSHAFCRVMSAALAAQGICAVPLAIGREEAIRLGKQYVHNDICFPAQVVIGEALAALRSGEYDGYELAIGMGKYIGDCRLTHYSALLRKALDDAGFADVPILTNDDVDYHDLHPGFRMNLLSALRIAFALPMIDVLEELLRKIRPYETEAGAADRAFEEALTAVVDGLEKHGILGARKGFRKAIGIMKRVSYDRTNPRPRVLIVGEYLLNFHPGANHDIEAYLEKNGFEIIEARMTDVIRKTYFCIDEQIRNYDLKREWSKKVWYHAANRFFELAHDMTDQIAKEHPLYERAVRLPELVVDSDPIIPHTFDAGEGVLIPGEILHHAKHGCRAFVILQPFGCLPNHVVGRGIVRRLKELYPDAQILPLDYDPDVSFANIENRLQMLIMNAREKRFEEEKKARK